MKSRQKNLGNSDGLSPNPIKVLSQLHLKTCKNPVTSNPVYEDFNSPVEVTITLPEGMSLDSGQGCSTSGEVVNLFKGRDHLKQVQEEALAIVEAAFKAAGA